jgi:hypothetical protein
MSNPMFARARLSAVALFATVALTACSSNDQTYRPPAPRTTTTQPVYTSPSQPTYTQPSQPTYTQPAPRPPAGPQTSCGKGKCG